MVTSDLITPLEVADPSHRGLQMDLKDSQAVFRVRSGLISAFQNHPRHPLMCTHLEMVHSAHCALCTWQGDALHAVCSHLHLCLHFALCTMHYALGYYALCTALAPCTCTRHYALCTVLAPCTFCPQPTPDLCGVDGTEKRGSERGGGEEMSRRASYVQYKRGQKLVPSLYFTNMSFL